MKLYRFDKESATARVIDRFGSKEFTVGHILRSSKGAHVVCAYLGPSGVIGRHPTTANQLLLVVVGSGTVSGGDEVERPIMAGEAAMWEPGESHETRTDEGLTAIIVEAAEIDPFPLEEVER